MDIDVDWCLTCQKHIDGPHPYCSSVCHFSAFDNTATTTTTHTDDPLSKWSGIDDAGIAAWAADIPPNAPPLLDDCSSNEPPEIIERFTTGYHAPPNLLKSRRVAPPCLSTQLSLVPPPPYPTTASSSTSISKSSSKESTESSPLSTPSSSIHNPCIPIFCPSRKPSLFPDMYIHVRSWVSPSPSYEVRGRKPFRTTNP